MSSYRKKKCEHTLVHYFLTYKQRVKPIEMMSTADINLTLYFRKKHTPPPSVLLLTVPNDKSNKDQQFHARPFIELRSRQQKKCLATAYAAGSHANTCDVHDSSVSSYGWQRHSDKITQIIPAPDVAYRNTYLEETKQEKSATNNTDYRSRLSTPRSPSPRSQQSQPQQLPRLKTTSSTSYHSSDSSQRKPYRQYRTVYDYIRQSIKQIERQRDLKQKNLFTRVKRPQNDDVVLRRVLGEKKNSAKSRVSSLSKHDQDPQSLVNYINHSREQIRISHTTTPNQSYQQPQINQKHNRQRADLSQNQNDSLDNQESLIMTATVGNS